MKYCPFCEIISGDKESHKIYEDNYCLAFLDINPEVKGHMLLVPKKHYENLEDIDEYTLSQMAIALKNINQLLIDNKFSKASNVILSSGIIADQSVNHFHYHILPRNIDDGFNVWSEQEASDDDISDLEIVQKEILGS